MGRIQMQRGSVRQVPPQIYAGFIDSGEPTEESLEECRHIIWMWVGIFILGLVLMFIRKIFGYEN